MNTLSPVAVRQWGSTMLAASLTALDIRSVRRGLFEGALPAGQSEGVSCPSGQTLWQANLGHYDRPIAGTRGHSRTDAIDRRDRSRRTGTGVTRHRHRVTKSSSESHQ